MSTSKLIKRKRILIKTIYNHELNNSNLIYFLLKNKKLDILVRSLNNNSNKFLSKKSKYSSNIKFLELLDYFINMFSINFYFIGKQKNIILEALFAYANYNDVFLETYNLTDNKYIEYFKIEMQKKIVYGFYKNLINLYDQSEIIKNFFENKKINTNIDLNNKEDVSILYQALKQLSLTSTHNWEVIYLFEKIDVYINNLSNEITIDHNQTLQITTNFYILQWERMIDNYYKNKDLAMFLLN